ncbi:hypothetical protein CDAR_236301 [Caerostris darwini]|uniref:DUF7044 domain-containing protein n=1 Tax=Caerostris darwini TaxID=1538125 RepID=A0AAV4TBV3_9ARAC|nr:hypothetical protein CDAR_236301 [Caerostris darwini]
MFSSADTCTFPNRWTGSWFQKGSPDPIRIYNGTVSSKGTCRENDKDKFLIENTNRSDKATSTTPDYETVPELQFPPTIHGLTSLLLPFPIPSVFEVWGYLNLTGKLHAPLSRRATFAVHHCNRTLHVMERGRGREPPRHATAPTTYLQGFLGAITVCCMPPTIITLPEYRYEYRYGFL